MLGGDAVSHCEKEGYCALASHFESLPSEGCLNL